MQNFLIGVLWQVISYNNYAGAVSTASNNKSNNNVYYSLNGEICSSQSSSYLEGKQKNCSTLHREVQGVAENLISFRNGITLPFLCLTFGVYIFQTQKFFDYLI